MSEPSYFDDPERAAALFAEARSWLGTPFREFYQQDFEKLKELHPEKTFDLKGIGGGIDCVGLVQEILFRTGATEKFIFRRDTADYQSHQLQGKVLNWLRGKLEDPQSTQLANIFVELEIPNAVKDPLVPTPRDFFKPGDICVMQHWSLFHMPIIIDKELHFVSAMPRLGIAEGTIQDATYSQHLVTVFRLRPKP